MFTRRNALLALIVVSAFAAAWWFRPAPPLQFASVQEARERITAAGLCCVSLDEHVTLSLVISDDELTHSEANEFHHRHMTVNRKGKVFLFRTPNGENSEIERTWGGVSALGDPVLLDKIELLLRR